MKYNQICIFKQTDNIKRFNGDLQEAFKCEFETFVSLHS